MQMTNKGKFAGLVTTLPTPFSEDGRSIDVAALRAFRDREFEAGIQGPVVAGSVGGVHDSARPVLHCSRSNRASVPSWTVSSGSSQ